MTFQPIDVRDIKVGDRIQAVPMSRNVDDYIAYHGVVIEIHPDMVETNMYGLSNSAYEFFLTERPAPVEPNGLGAVAEVRTEANEPWRIVRIQDYDNDFVWIDSQGDTMMWSSWINYSRDGQIRVLSEGYIPEED